MPRSKGRTGRPYRRSRELVKKRGLPCPVCGKAIDLTLPPDHPMSFVADHIVPLAYGGSPVDPNNLQGMHRKCNGRKGTKALEAVRIPRSSRDW